MEKELVVKQGEIVNIEDQAMSIASLLGQVKLIQDVMEKVMAKDEHYGTIPGTKKPTLYKPGAEKLCLTFRLDPDYEIIREVREKDFIAYTVKCNLTHIPTGQRIASGIGSCNSRESKYRYRFIEESTGVPIPKKYWDAKKKGDNKEMKRCLQIPNMDTDNLRAAKIEGQWVIAKSEKIENDNPWDLDNTLIKMACKRSLVAATLNATAASDIFTQDIEDMPSGIIGGEGTKKPQKSSQDRNLGGTGNDQGEEDTLPQKKVWSSKKVFVEDIKSFEHEDMLGLDQYVDMLTLHDINPDELLSLNKEQGLALFLDLEKALKTKNKNSF